MLFFVLLFVVSFLFFVLGLDAGAGPAHRARSSIGILRMSEFFDLFTFVCSCCFLVFCRVCVGFFCFVLVSRFFWFVCLFVFDVFVLCVSGVSVFVCVLFLFFVRC